MKMERDEGETTTWSTRRMGGCLTRRRTEKTETTVVLAAGGEARRISRWEGPVIRETLGEMGFDGAASANSLSTFQY